MPDARTGRCASISSEIQPNSRRLAAGNGGPKGPQGPGRIAARALRSANSASPSAHLVGAARHRGAQSAVPRSLPFSQPHSRSPSACDVAMADGGSTSSGGVVARQAGELYVEQGHRGPGVQRIQRALGIPADGVFGPMTERAVRRFQRRRGLVVDGVVGPVTRRALGHQQLQPPLDLPPPRRAHAARAQADRTVRVGRQPARGLARRAATAASTSSRAAPGSRLGGSGDPARAPEWLQDRMALKLYRLRGKAPWPSCSR